MNQSQKKFIQFRLLVLAIIFFLLSWKILPPDDYWLETSKRIVVEISKDQEAGVEARLGSRMLSLLVGLVLPVVLIGTVLYLHLGGRE